MLLSGGPRVVSSQLRPGAEIIANNSPVETAIGFDRPVAPPPNYASRLTRLEDGRTFPLVATWLEYENYSYRIEYPPVPPGTYELRLLSMYITESSGARLDGELANDTFPSGDGLAGGDLVLRFTAVETEEFVPLSPKQLQAFPVSSGAIDLQFFSGSDNAYGYVVERADGDGPFVQIADKAGGRTLVGKYTDATAQPGVGYRYRVRNYSKIGRRFGPYSNEVAAQVLPPELALPVQTLTAQPGLWPDWLTEVNGSVFFTMTGNTDSANGRELWKTDGTPEGTLRLYSGKARSLVDFNGTLFFAGWDADAGYELWKSDGTVDGTVRVADVRQGPAGSSMPRMLGVLGDQLLFAAAFPGMSEHYREYEIWKTDGTAEGTARVTDVLVCVDDAPEFTVGDPLWEAHQYSRTHAVSGRYLYFRRGDGLPKAELWRTDGTAEGTQRVLAISDESEPRWFTDFGGRLFFTAHARPVPDVGQLPPRALFRVDETVAGPTAVRVFTQGTFVGGPHLAYLTTVNGQLFFSADTQRLGRQIHVSDGTAAGTRMVGAVRLGFNDSQYSIVDAGGTAFYFANYAPPSLFKSDGTFAGTVPVREFDFTYAWPDRSPYFILPVGNKVVYSDGNVLWHSDGTRAGSYQVAPVGPQYSGQGGTLGFSGPAAVAVGDRVFFSTKQPDGGRELRVVTVTPPAAPAGLQVEPVAAGAQRHAGPGPAAAQAGLRVSWNDMSANESGFVAERSRRSDFGVIDKILYAPPNASTLVDTTALAGVAHFYRVRAANAGGASPFSNTAAPPATVAGRHVFYNNSAFDGFNPVANSDDDAAVAHDKHPLVPGATSTPANVTNYSRGLNGLLIDVAGLWGEPNTNDFEFHVGHGAHASAWAAAPAPAVSVRRGAGASGSDRVTFTWPDGTIRNTWLRVTTKSTDRTGLAGTDVFYYGNLAGDAGTAAPARVDASDRFAVRAARAAGDLTSRFDFNRDGRVDVLDELITRANQGQSLPLLTAAPPVGPLAIPRRARSAYDTLALGA